ncbi:hypothetical protein KBC03_03920 [Patescibacteria group bacterium]|nr:hypothetical protein [Patescibacteria group bacterium]
MNNLPATGDRYETKASIPAAYLQPGSNATIENLTDKFIHSKVQFEVEKSDLPGYLKVRTLGSELLVPRITIFYINEAVWMEPLNRKFFAEAEVHAV